MQSGACQSWRVVCLDRGAGATRRPSAPGAETHVLVFKYFLAIKTFQDATGNLGLLELAVWHTAGVGCLRWRSATIIDLSVCGPVPWIGGDAAG
jgi:hypothetical protein